MTQKDAELIMKTVPAEVLVNSNPDYCGAVQKKNNAGKFQYRYCIIHHGIFYYFEDWKSKKPSGYFSLAGYRAIRSVEKHELIFVLKNQDNKRTYIFSAGCNRELDEWIENVNSAVEKYHPSQSPFYNPYTSNPNLCGEYSSSLPRRLQHQFNPYTDSSMISNNTNSQYSDPHSLPPRPRPLNRSPSITSSTSSNSTNSNLSYGSTRSSEDSGPDPIYEEVSKDQKQQQQQQQQQQQDEEEEPFYNTMDAHAHYDHINNPYNIVEPRYSAPRNWNQQEGLEEDGTYVEVGGEDPYVSMQNPSGVNTSQGQGFEEKGTYVQVGREGGDIYEPMHNPTRNDPDSYNAKHEEYEDMNPAKYNDVINNKGYDSMGGINRSNVLPTENASSPQQKQQHYDDDNIIVPNGYEKMNPQKYHAIICGDTDHIDSTILPEDSNVSDTNIYIDLTPDSCLNTLDSQIGGELYSQSSTITYSRNNFEFNTKAELPPTPPLTLPESKPLPPPPILPLTLPESKPLPPPPLFGWKSDIVVQQTTPVPLPRPRQQPRKSVHESVSELKISDDQLSYPSVPPPVPNDRPKQCSSNITYQVNEISPPPPRPRSRRSSAVEDSMPQRLASSPVPPPRSMISLQNQEVNTSPSPSNHGILPEHIFISGLGKEMCGKYFYNENVGTYLIRTNRADGNDALAVKSAIGDAKHYIIFSKQERFYLKKDEPSFDTVADLIVHYYDNSLPTADLYLTGPMQKKYIDYN